MNRRKGYYFLILTAGHGDYYLQKLATELLFELMAGSVIRFVRQNRAGIEEK